MGILKSPAAQAVQREIEALEASTSPGEIEPELTKPRTRGPGRPLGSKNKTPEERAAAKSPRTQRAVYSPPPPPTPPKSEIEKVAASAKDKSNKKDTPNPPDFTEWRDFLGEVVLHWFSVAFIAIAFRGVPYHEMLTDEDAEDIQLDEDELKAVARPFAHLVSHSKLNGKYGRAIMNSRDTIEAAVVMFMWGARVNRIAKKYKWQYQQIMEVQENVARIPRPDRARDTSEANPPPEVAGPIAGIAHSAFGHGFN